MLGTLHKCVPVARISAVVILLIAGKQIAVNGEA